MIALKQEPEPTGGPREEARRAAKGAVIVSPPHKDSFCEACHRRIPRDVPYVWSVDWHIAGHDRSCIRRAIAEAYDGFVKTLTCETEPETMTA